MTAVVFLGPSLPAAWEAPPAGVTLRPPAARGDVLRALRDGATAIGVIDGLFGSVPSVWHKEILLALDAGIPVLGAASMGALRAAECAAFGMEPVGEVAAAYLDGRLEADDAVAVLHAGAEHGWLRLSDALVDLHDLHSAAVSAGVLTAATAATLDAIASELHWTERRGGSVLAEARTRGVAGRDLEAVAAMARTHTGVKARDAALLLKRLAGGPSSPPPGEVGVARTIHLHGLARAIGTERRPWGSVRMPARPPGGGPPSR